MSKDEMKVDAKADHTLSDELQFKEMVKAPATTQHNQGYGTHAFPATPPKNK